MHEITACKSKCFLAAEVTTTLLKKSETFAGWTVLIN